MGKKEMGNREINKNREKKEGMMGDIHNKQFLV